MNNSSVSSPFLALKQCTAPPSIAELPGVVSLSQSSPECDEQDPLGQRRRATQSGTLDSPTFSGHLQPMVSVLSPCTVAASVRIENTPMSTLTPMVPYSHFGELNSPPQAEPDSPPQAALPVTAIVEEEPSGMDHRHHLPLETPPSLVFARSEPRRHVREQSANTQPFLDSDANDEPEDNLKWKVLPVMCFLTFGVYYTMDFPASIGTGDGVTIQSLFGSKNKEYNQAMNQALYSVYSYPNTVLAIFGGLLIDKYIGLRKSMLLFTMLVLMGSVFFFVAVHLTNYPLLLAARFLFGLGGECLFVAKSAFVARWFRGGRGMALAFGITISFSRVGSSFNFLFSPRIADNWNIQMACVAGVIACFLSLIACIVLIFADIYAVKKGLIKAEAVGNAEESGDVMKFKDLLKLPLELWLICAICIFCYCAIFPFVGIAKNYFQVKYNMSGSDASTWISLYQFAAAGASPIIGALVDQTGRYPQWLAAASGCLALSLLMLMSTSTPSVGVASMPIMGLFYSFLVSGLWPSVPFAVSENMCGMAYGIITALQNFGLATLPLMMGFTLDAYTPLPTQDRPIQLPTLKGFSIAISLCIGCACISLLFSLLLWVIDIRKGARLLTRSAKARRDNHRHWFNGQGVLSSSPAQRCILIKELRHQEQLSERTGGTDSDSDELNRTAAIIVRRSMSCEVSDQEDRAAYACWPSFMHELKNGADDILLAITRPKGIACVCIVFIMINMFPFSAAPTTTTMLAPSVNQTHPAPTAESRLVH